MGKKKTRVSLNVLSMKEGKWFSPDVMMYYSELANCTAVQHSWGVAVAEGKDEVSMNNRKTGTGLLLTEAQRRPSSGSVDCL